jgi:hypothetical protein
VEQRLSIIIEKKKRKKKKKEKVKGALSWTFSKAYFFRLNVACGARKRINLFYFLGHRPRPII